MTGPWEDYTPPSQVADMVTSEARRQGVPPDLALRVATQESGLHHGAVSPRGAVGVMQLMPGTAHDMGVDPTDLQQNITGGVRYLKHQLDTFGDPRLAAAAYNAGPEAVAKHGGVPPYPETQGYVDAVSPQAPPNDSPPWADYAASPAGGGPPAPAQVAAASPAAPAPARTSQLLGFEKGVGQPIDRLYGRIESNPIASGVADAVGSVVPQFDAARRIASGLIHDRLLPYIAQQEANGVKPGAAGQFGGNMLATAFLPGGPAVNGALTGAALSDAKDPGDIARDAIYGAIGGKVAGSAVKGLGHLVSGVTDPAVRLLASKGVPLTVGQLAGGLVRSTEDKLTSVPVLGDMIRNAQRRGLEGVNRAAFNDTLGKIGETLPPDASIGHDAYSYTKQRLKDAYDEVLAPLVVKKDTPWNQAVSAAKAQINKIGDPATKANALNIIKSELDARFGKAGVMDGQALKDAQSDLGAHADSLLTDTGPSRAWSRKAGQAIGDLKGALEGLVARTDPAAGDRLAQVNSAYASLKPLEAAGAKAGVKGEGVFTLNQLAQGIAKGRAATTLAAGNAPHQPLASAAARVLPSTVPDSGTAGRSAMMILGGALLGGAHSLPVAGPFAMPLGGLIGGTAALYTRAGQKALTALATTRNDTARAVGHYLNLLAAPVGTAGAISTAGLSQ